MATTTLNPDGTPKSMMQLAAEKMAADNAVDPTLTAFDESKGVAGRVADITSANSPLMQQAATRGTQIAAQRGLTNSSLAAGASQGAVLQAATPIASADASLYGQAQLANMQAANQAKTTNATLGVQAGTTGLQLTESGRQADVASSLEASKLGEAKRQADATLSQRQAEMGQQQSQFETTTATNSSQFNAELQQRQQQFAATQEQQRTLTTLDQANKIQLANIEAQFKNEIQSNTNISQAWGTMTTSITQIQNNPQLDADAKRTLIQNQLDNFSAFGKFWSKQQPVAADIQPLLDFGMPGAPGAPGAANTPGAGAVAAPTTQQAADANPYAPGGAYYGNGATPAPYYESGGG